MAIGLIHKNQVAETPALDDEFAFAETLADHVFAAEVIAPAVEFTADNERLDTNSNEDVEAETPWLADELLERVFG